MNVTLSSFVLLSSLSESPFLQLSNQKNTVRLKLSSILCKNHFSNFFLSNQDKFNFKILKSKFDSFLLPPILLSSMNITSTFFNHNLIKTQFFESSHQLYVKECVFSNCFNPGDGGGIVVNKNDAIFSIETSIFDNCISNNGGGVYSTAKQHNIKNVIFDKCFSYQNGISFYINSNSHLRCESILIKNSPNFGSKCSLNHSLYANGGIQIYKNANITQNIILQNLGIYSTPNSNSFYKYIILSHNKCKCSILLSANSNLSNFFFYNNTYYNPKDNNSLLILSNFSYEFCNFYFEKNNFEILFSGRNTKINLMSCIFDIKNENIKTNNVDLTYINCTFKNKESKSNIFDITKSQKNVFNISKLIHEINRNNKNSKIDYGKCHPLATLINEKCVCNPPLKGDGIVQCGSFSLHPTIKSISPNYGPETGGNIIKIVFKKKLPSSINSIFCAFGNKIVIASNVTDNYATCIAPKYSQMEVKFSISYNKEIWSNSINYTFMKVNKSSMKLFIPSGSVLIALLLWMIIQHKIEVESDEEGFKISENKYK